MKGEQPQEAMGRAAHLRSVPPAEAIAAIDTELRTRWTPLMFFAAAGALGSVKARISTHPEEINKRTAPHGTTALMAAARYGHAAVVEMLIANGAKPDHANRNGTTPLMYAASAGHASVVEMLIANGADINKTTVFGETALTVIGNDNGYTEIVKILTKGYSKPRPPPEPADTSQRARMRDDLKRARLIASYEVLVRNSDLSNPGLAEVERLRRAEHLLTTYKRLHRVNPDFRDDSEQIKAARSITNRANYRRQLANSGRQPKKAKLAM
jgi:Ankyrin repeats (3 copies)